MIARKEKRLSIVIVKERQYWNIEQHSVKIDYVLDMAHIPLSEI